MSQTTDKTILIVGLGNPAPEYQKTPHNAGFWVVEEFISNSQRIFESAKKVHSKVAKIKTSEKEIIVIKPQTYMNNSGLAVREAQNFWKIRTADIIVVHDDSDILLGKLKISANQSSGGHKGVESIIKSLGSTNFTRIKIGVRPISKAKSELQGHIKAEKFILKSFPPKIIETVSKKGTEVLEVLIHEGFEQSMNMFNNSSFTL